jgi:hypothetical protein
MKSKARQQEFGFTNHGGKRKGAGRKPKGAKAGVSHEKRVRFKPYQPLMITMRVCEGLPSLRADKGLAGRHARRRRNSEAPDSRRRDLSHRPRPKRGGPQAEHPPPPYLRVTGQYASSSMRHSPFSSLRQNSRNSVTEVCSSPSRRVVRWEVPSW